MRSDPPPLPRPATSVRVTALRPGRSLELPDTVVTEEPLELRAAGPRQEPQALWVTMRTPGHDFDLAAGALLAEGLIGGAGDLAAIRYCDLPDLDGAPAVQRWNIVTVGLTRPLPPGAMRRATASTASCGICGTATLDDLEGRCASVAPAPPFPASLVLGLPSALRAAQPVFERTGGLHAAGLFDREGSLVLAREDVGRHNAVDKVVGAALLGGRLPLTGHVLVLSGRIGYELVQKAAVAGIGVIAAVSAPSSLAVATAARFGICLLGFVRGGTANVYSHPERLQLDR